VLRPKPTPKPEEQEVESGDIIKVNTNLVTLNVRVIDRANRPLSNVRQTDFHVYEDGAPQTIEFFSKEEVPVSYGLAVDTSLSLRSQIQSVIDASKIIINSNKPGDETFIERFISSDKINTEKEFTANKDELLDAVDNLYLEGGQTAVIDGVYLAAEHVAEHKKGDDSDRRRLALIVITDGEDRHSYFTEAQLMERLREEDVQIYIIGFVNELEKESGFVKITRDLRTQYVVGYNPTNKARDGSYRTIRVTVDSTASDDRRLALTRPGYTAPRGESLRPNLNGTRPPTTTAERKPLN
jgi:Ca-activated chloride channel family protein